MKKIGFILSALIVSCQNPISIDPILDQKYEIVKNIHNLDSQGFFSTLKTIPNGGRNFGSDNVSVEEIKIAQDKIDQITTDPMMVLSEIEREEDGQYQIDLIETMLSSESTAQDVVDKMNKLDPKLAVNYRESLESQFEQLTANMDSRSIQFDLTKIKLRHYSSSDDLNRGFLDPVFDWNTVYWYMGYSATTIAGLAVYKWTPEWVMSWWGPTWTGWIRWVGLGTAAGGATLMTTQLIKWYQNDKELQDLGVMVKELYNAYNVLKSRSTVSSNVDYLRSFLETYLKDHGGTFANVTMQQLLTDFVTEYNKAPNDFSKFAFEISKIMFTSETGGKIWTVLGATAAPVTFAYIFCPEVVDWILSAPRNAWNLIVSLFSPIRIVSPYPVPTLL